MTQLHTPDVLSPQPPRLPPLQNGDRLTRIEFERRYHAMPHVHKAQLIEGIVFMPSPVSFVQHANPHFNLIGWLGGYAMHTPGVEGGDNGSLRLDVDNEPQPDAFLLIHPDHGGQARFEDGYVAGAPELVAEVAASSVNIDLHAKLNAYQRNGVREYLVWRVEERALDWFVLRDGRFVPLALGADGLYRSEVLPGLQLDPAALIEGNVLRLLQLTQAAVATPEHAAFVARLRDAARQQ